MKRIIIALLVSFVSIAAQAESDPYKEVFASPPVPNIIINDNDGHGQGKPKEDKVSTVPLSGSAMIMSLGLFCLMSVLYVGKKNSTVG